MFKKEGQASNPMISINKTYVRKRRKNEWERENLGKTTYVPILDALVSSKSEEHQTFVDRGASKWLVGSDKGK